MGDLRFRCLNGFMYALKTDMFYLGNRPDSQGLCRDTARHFATVFCSNYVKVFSAAPPTGASVPEAPVLLPANNLPQKPASRCRHTGHGPGVVMMDMLLELCPF